jgi:hypothetical protein
MQASNAQNATYSELSTGGNETLYRRNGLKPGQKHSGSFRTGYDPRRVGGYKAVDGMTIAQMARQRGPKCIELWERAMDDEQIPWPVRLRASELMMDRGFGKAVSVIETHSRPIQSLTREELEAIASGETPRLPITIAGEAVEVPLAVRLAGAEEEA